MRRVGIVAGAVAGLFLLVHCGSLLPSEEEEPSAPPVDAAALVDAALLSTFAIDASTGAGAVEAGPRCTTCALRGATCGTFSDECGGTLPCGTCAPTSSCNVTDAGSSCVPLPCEPEPIATTCAGRCQTQTDRCGGAHNCGGCPDQSFCGAVGAGICGCPARQTPLYEYVDPTTGKHCDGPIGSCGNWTYLGPIGSIYSNPYDGLVPLYRCVHIFGPGHFGFLLTTSPTCEAPQTWAMQGQVGFCAPGPRCGAIPLHRYFHPPTGDVLNGLGPAPPGWAHGGDPCFVWP